MPRIDRMRLVGNAEANLAANLVELETLRATLNAARKAGEVQAELASDRPARFAAGRMA